MGQKATAKRTRKRFPTPILDEAVLQKKQALDEERVEMIGRTFAALDALSVNAGFSAAYLFGSIAKAGMFSRNSDIDVGFAGLDDRGAISAAAFLSRRLGRDVDVVQIEKHRLHHRIKEGIKWKRGG